MFPRIVLLYVLLCENKSEETEPILVPCYNYQDYTKYLTLYLPCFLGSFFLYVLLCENKSEENEPILVLLLQLAAERWDTQRLQENTRDDD